MRFGFVVQRYGEGVDGGAEVHCRQIATRLAARGHDVTVHTTTAQDYLTWQNHFAPGLSQMEGVTLRRFSVARRRWVRPFNIWARKIYAGGQPLGMQWRWLVRQGPYVPELVWHLAAHQEDFDCLVFFTYLYYPTTAGLPMAPCRAVLVPTAHDEPPLYLPVFRPVFHLPRAIFYNTQAEQDLVRRVHENDQVPGRVVGLGIDPPARGGARDFRERHGITGDFLLYLGRVDVMKGCQEMFDDFQRLAARPDLEGLKLVLVGKSHMELPRHPGIVSLGFVSDAERDAALDAATALVMPSPYESLSMVTLEASAANKPVLVNAGCEVLASYARRSGAGLCYRGADELEQAVRTVLEHPEQARHMGQQGAEYVKANYGWQRVLDIYEEQAASLVGP